MSEDFAIKQGTSGSSLDVTVYNDDDSPVDFTDADAVTFTLRAEDSETETFSKAGLVLGDPTKGNLRYVWAAGDTDTPGTYYAEFAVHFPAGTIIYPGDGPLIVTVVPNLSQGVEETPGAFATVADVRNITRQTVTEDDVAVAQVMIEMLVGRSVMDIESIEALDAELGTRDAYWLKVATAFQAVWMKGQPDLFQRWSMKSVSQAGYAGRPGPLAEFYGPGASMAAGRLSWMRSRKVRVRRPRMTVSRNFLSDDLFSGTDLDTGWTNLH